MVCKPPVRKKRVVAPLVYSGFTECLCTSVEHILHNRVPFITFLSLDMPTWTIWTDFELQHRPCRAMKRDGRSNNTAAQFLVWARLLPHLIHTVPKTKRFSSVLFCVLSLFTIFFSNLVTLSNRSVLQFFFSTNQKLL